PRGPSSTRCRTNLLLAVGATQASIMVMAFLPWMKRKRSRKVWRVARTRQQLAADPPSVAPDWTVPEVVRIGIREKPVLASGHAPFLLTIPPRMHDCTS